MTSRKFLSAIAIFASLFTHQAVAVTIRLQPSADTTLVETVPENNLGATAFVNAGTSGIDTRNRGLFRFDFSAIPAGSKILSATLTLQVIKQPSGGGETSLFDLHRMLKDWGEGDKDSSAETSAGFGFPATANEATWNSPFAFSTNVWTSPGASGDFVATPSSSSFVLGDGDLPQFNCTPLMIADVQAWLDNPSTNFGWLLKTESEGIARTARGFGSREFAGIDTNSPPYLEVEIFSAPRITGTEVANGQVRFLFFAESNQGYVVEFKNTLSTSAWTTLTNIPPQSEAGDISVSDSISDQQRFYRVTVH